MSNAIILHGKPSRLEYYDPHSPAQSNKHWLPWLQRQLSLQEILAQTPELPLAYNPNYDAWKAVFEQFSVDETTLLIGHSCGAGFLLRWLSEQPRQVGKVALVAPWLDPEHTLTNGFFDFTLNPTLVSRTAGVHVFVSADDDGDVQTSVQQIMTALPSATLHQFSDKGHFTAGDMGTEQFPELLEVLIHG